MKRHPTDITAVTTNIQNAIIQCWQLLPDHERTIENLRRMIGAMVEQNLKNFRDDPQTFAAWPDAD